MAEINYLDTTAQTAYFELESGVGFMMVDSASNMREGAKFQKVKPTTNTDVTQKPVNGIMPWGTDNRYPNKLLSLIDTNHVLKSSFDRITKATFSNGVITKVWDADENGSAFLKPIRLPEFEAFKRRNGNLLTCFQGIKDLFRLDNSFVELVKSSDGQKILMMKYHPAVQCRLTEQNSNGIIDTVKVQADWSKRNANDATTVDRPLLNHADYFAAENIVKNPKGNLFLHYKTLADKVYYADSSWLSTDVYDLIDISSSWTKFFKHVLINTAVLKYKITIKDWYWPACFSNWYSMTFEEKINAKKSEYAKFNKHISNIEKNGSAIFVDTKTGAGNAGREIIGDFTKFSDAWEISILDQGKLDQTFTEAYNKANVEIQFALGYDPATGGSHPNETRQGGSDKSQSFNILLTMCEYVRQLSLQPLYLIAQINGWPDDIVFDYDLPVMQTLAALSPKDRQLKPSN